MSLLMQAYQQRLYIHIRRMVNSHDDADDILQEVFIKAWKGMEFFREDAKLFTWLYKIASNECLSHHRKKKAHLIPIDKIPGNHQPQSNEKGLPGDEIIRKLEAAVSTLPPKQRLVFHMRYYEEMPYEQISEVVETSVGALKASYHHAVKKIEDFLSNG